MNEALSPKATRPETKLQLWRTKKIRKEAVAKKEWLKPLLKSLQRQC